MNVVSGMSISFSSFEHHESCNYIANYHNENFLVAVPQEVGLILALFVLLALFALISGWKVQYVGVPAFW